MSSLLHILPFFLVVLASPILQDDAEIVCRRSNSVVPPTLASRNQLSSIISGLQAEVADLVVDASVFVEILTAIIPVPTPASIAAELSSVASIYRSHPTTFLENALNLVIDGLTPENSIDLILGESPIENSSKNLNLVPAISPVYPTAGPRDAPYSLTENNLRSAIYIPPAFTYGKIPPLIFIPGTGGTAGQQFAGNFGKIFTGSNYADPVYLNIPHNQLDDLQINAEYVAYAVNYISSISGHKNVSMLGWSAGSLNGQWAFQYWPSTRKIVSDFIIISGDLHGTVLFSAICPSFPTIPCPPAVIQVKISGLVTCHTNHQKQKYNSKYISTSRNGGSSSAYVPTTSIYSALDEIVQPQEGTSASAYILDTRQVGVSNTEVQAACTIFQPAGTLYTHEGMLYNPVAVALAIDALTHPGPGEINRIDLSTQCQRLVADGLSLVDVLATQLTIPIAAYEIVVYPNKVDAEPQIAAYAGGSTNR